MTEIELLQTLEAALAHHRSGRLGEAEALYRRVLEKEPTNPDALHLLGVASHQQGRHEQAVDYISRAIAAENSVADYHNNLGEALGAAGRADESIVSYRRAIELDPDRADAAYNLGRTLVRKGRLEEAIVWLHKALKLRPELPEAHYELGVALLVLGRAAEAEAAFNEAIRLRETYPEAHANLGSALVKQGRRDDAIASYHRALQLRPDLVGAYAQLGSLLHEQGKTDEAIRLVQTAARHQPSDPNALNQLGDLLANWARLREAAELHRQVLQVHPDDAEALTKLGILSEQLGELEAAGNYLRRAGELEPWRADLQNNLGAAAQDAGRGEEALRHFKRAVAMRPASADFHANVGTSLFKLGRTDKALVACRRAVELAPHRAEMHRNLAQILRTLHQPAAALQHLERADALDPRRADFFSRGDLLRDLGRIDDAINVYRAAIAHKPEDATTALNKIGNCLQATGRAGDAERAYRDAIAADPNRPEPYNNLANCLYEQHRIGEALRSYEQSLALQPDDPLTQMNFANMRQALGRHTEAIAGFRRALELKPDYADAHSNLLLAMNYDPSYEPKQVFDEHLNFARTHAHKLRGPRTFNDRNPERPLRIGYLSSDFRSHSVAYFLDAVLSLDRASGLEVVCYSRVRRPDAVTRRLRQHASLWRDVAGVPPDALADQVRQDRIDILVDLAGHTAGNQLLVFARKPAPIQVTYLGYPNTTGLDAIDYRITDSHADPPGMTDAYHTETLLRLDPCAWCYRPPEAAPDLCPPPSHGTGQVTFGSFNAASKINDRTLALWSRVLLEVPGSRLQLKNEVLGEPLVRSWLQEEMLRHGIEPDRIEMLGWRNDPAAHLQLYQKVDVALDTFPYHGTTTTCEALWMGVPVVSLAGRTHVSRVGVSLLSNVGLAELATASDEEFVAVASSLATEASRLASVRAGMRQRLRASPLLDSAGFSRRLGDAYRSIWRKSCAQAL